MASVEVGRAHITIGAKLTPLFSELRKARSVIKKSLLSGASVGGIAGPVGAVAGALRVWNVEGR